MQNDMFVMCLLNKQWYFILILNLLKVCYSKGQQLIIGYKMENLTYILLKIINHVGIGEIYKKI